MPYKKRRRTRFSRKRYRKRYRRYPMLRRERSYPEVKYYDLTLPVTKAIPMHLGLNNDLPATGNIFPNMLDGITEGTTGGNRIGRKIYLKKIIIRANLWLCGFEITQGSTTTFQNISNAMVRVMIHDSRANTTQSIGNLFTGAVVTRDRISDFLARRNYKIYYDRLHNISAGIGVNSSSTSTYQLAGKMYPLKISLTINRNVEYQSTGSVRDDADVFSLSATSMTPTFDLLNGTDYVLNGKSPICSNWRARIYFTDS